LLLLARTIAWGIKVQEWNYTALYTFTRIDGICIGCLLALLQQRDKEFINNNLAIIVTVLAMLNFGFYFLNRTNQYPFFAFIGYTTFAAMFGLLVHEAAFSNNQIVQFIFTMKPFKFLGRISYGLYIFHWPLYVALKKPLHHFFFQSINLSGSFSSIVTSITITTLAIGIAIISYYCFEIKFLKLKSSFL
jgi:peptidoglycan/LPS O-acetylase OafA/YrhL